MPAITPLSALVIAIEYGDVDDVRAGSDAPEGSRIQRPCGAAPVAGDDPGHVCTVTRQIVGGGVVADLGAVHNVVLGRAIDEIAMRAHAAVDHGDADSFTGESIVGPGGGCADGGGGHVEGGTDGLIERDASHFRPPGEGRYLRGRHAISGAVNESQLLPQASPISSCQGVQTGTGSGLKPDDDIHGLDSRAGSSKPALPLPGAVPRRPLP